jgi:hypothetical protein
MSLGDKIEIARANHSLPPLSLATLDAWRKLEGHADVKAALDGLSDKIVGGLK